MNTRERLRLFWMGKKARTRNAVEVYLQGVNGDLHYMTQNHVAQKYKVTDVSIRENIKKLHDSGLLKLYITDRNVLVYYEINQFCNIDSFLYNLEMIGVR